VQQTFSFLFFGKIVAIQSRANGSGESFANGAAGSRIHINLVAAAGRAAESVALLPDP
jgi:hypothetical protein